MASHVLCLQEYGVSYPLGIGACHLFEVSSGVQSLFCLRLKEKHLSS